jgi:pimeloyl-ACP methyl ester carboxylesterase
LFVDGEQSSYRALGREIDRRLACFQRVERVTLPRAGHMLQRHEPELLTRVLSRFLGGRSRVMLAEPGDVP